MIQRVYRGTLEAKPCERAERNGEEGERQDQRHKQERKAAAAVKIQSIQRGNSARAQIKAKTGFGKTGSRNSVGLGNVAIIIDTKKLAASQKAVEAALRGAAVQRCRALQDPEKVWCSTEPEYLCSRAWDKPRMAAWRWKMSPEWLHWNGPRGEPQGLRAPGDPRP